VVAGFACPRADAEAWPKAGAAVGDPLPEGVAAVVGCPKEATAGRGFCCPKAEGGSLAEHGEEDNTGARAEPALEIKASCLPDAGEGDREAPPKESVGALAALPPEQGKVLPQLMKARAWPKERPVLAPSLCLPEKGGPCAWECSACPGKRGAAVEVAPEACAEGGV